MSDFRTPLGRVRGRGSAREGTMHFWMVRLTSIALLPLSLFAIGLVIGLAGQDYAYVRSVLGQPLVAILLFLLQKFWVFRPSVASSHTTGLHP